MMEDKTIQETFKAVKKIEDKIKHEIYLQYGENTNSWTVALYCRYSENKARLFSIEKMDTAIKIIRIIEKQCFSLEERNEAIETAIEAILYGADLSNIVDYESIDKQLRYAIIVAASKYRIQELQELKHLNNVFNKNELEKYSTSELKAELRRRKKRCHD